MKQAIYIFSTIILGLIFTQGHHITWVVRYNLMAMLFFAFLNVQFGRGIFQKSHVRVLLVNLLLPLLLFFICKPFLSTNLAIIAFLVSMAPTAAVSPIIAQLLGEKPDFTTASVILTNPVVALVLPFTLPLVVAVSGKIQTLDILFPVILVVGVPLLVSQIIQRVKPTFVAKINRFKQVTFYLFLFNVWIGCGNASNFVQTQNTEGYSILGWIALLTAVICVLQFQIGKYLNPKLGLSGSLALGRKNTMFALWVALTYINPLAGIGPIFYIVWQNIYNSIQMLQQEQNLKLQQALK